MSASLADRDPAGPDSTAAILDSIAFVVARRRAMAVGAAVTFVLVVGVMLLVPRQYTSRASFVTEGASRAGIAALAGQFGVAIPTAGRNDSPDFYSDLLRSTDLLATLAADTIAVAERGGQRVPVLELLGVSGAPTPGKIESGIAVLRRIASSSVTRLTGVVNLSVVTPWPSVSRELADRLLKALNAFNIETRRSQAGEERRFIDGRLRVARDSLRIAEDKARMFLEANRQYQSSPQLAFEFQRLTRDIGFQQQLISSLAVSYEEVRAREIRDTPVITIIGQPTLPSLPNPRLLLLWGPLSMIAGAIFGALTSLGVDALVRRREAGDQRAADLLRFLARLGLKHAAAAPGDAH